MAGNKLFREEALKKSSNPEQLDQHVRITKPSAWVIITAILVLLAGVGVWAFTGNISNSVDVFGVMFPTDSLVLKTSNSGGMVTDVLVSETDVVEKGDTIAVVPDTELLSSIAAKQQEYNAATGEAKNTLELALNALKLQYISNSFITADKPGTINAVEPLNNQVEPGGTVAMTVVNESTANSKEIIAYVSYAIASKLKVGMDAQVTPINYKREEFGYMTGTVTRIGTKVITEEDIIRSMGSTKYVSGMELGSDAVEVRIRINVDNTSRNGFEWSNAKGKNIEKIDIGTICTIKVITENKRPINLLIG